MYGRAAIALLLLGCAAPLPGSRPVQPSYARAAIAAWTAAGYPAGSCRDDASDMRVLETDAAGVRSLCPSKRTVAGCSRGDVLVMDREYADAWLLAHETVHWLGSCSGVNTDDHDDLRLFQVPSSMQGKLATLGEVTP